ncbi:MAG TPA: porin family protein [Steroidobacteraceae bacterium]|jgi:OOP family OmpA-OmpF porin|nr:porin family protein [Steroidobacteraceae bacterium]
MSTRATASAVAILAGLLGVMSATSVRAEIQPGFYVGIGGGNSHLKLGDEDLEVEANDIGYKVFGGYNFGRYFAIEAAYFDGGVLTDDVFGFDLEFGLDGFVGSAVGRVPVSDAFSLFAKLGVASYDSKVSLGFDSQRDHQSDLSYAVGGELTFAEHWGLRIEFESIDISDGDFYMLGVSGLYRF